MAVFIPIDGGAGVERCERCETPTWDKKSERGVLPGDLEAEGPRGRSTGKFEGRCEGRGKGEGEGIPEP